MSILIAIFGIMAVGFIIDMPIGLAIFIASLYGVVTSGIPLELVANNLANSLNSFTLLAIPLFILAGQIMTKGSMAEKLVNFCLIFVGRFKSSLAIAAIVASTFFAALSGSGQATTAAIGGALVPKMKEQGYPAGLAAALVACAGVVGPIIPPSVTMVLFGVQTGASVGKMFMGGIIPGILMSGSLLVVLAIYMNFMDGKNRIVPLVTKKQTLKEKLLIVWDAKWALMMPVIILGSIYGGIATPTEAAVIAVVYSIVVGLFIERDMTVEDVMIAFKGGISTKGTIMLLVVAAFILGSVVTVNQIPVIVSNAITSITTNKIVIMLLINLVLLFLGMIMETMGAMLISTPILMPLALQCGLTPITYGVVCCMNLALGYCTPPVGISTFIASAIADAPISEMFKYLMLFTAALMIVVLACSFFPGIIEIIPNMMQ
ncbi:MAG: TRAP transporter large permease [Negativicutes bacterium]|jgi:C4-dicarboxylate transporter DctM subunit